MNWKNNLLVLLGSIALGAFMLWPDSAAELQAMPQKDGGKSVEQVQVEAARRSVKMLDDLYKTAIVALTLKYVEDETSDPAIQTAQGLFDVMKKNG